jgi:hypothetical protein
MPWPLLVTLEIGRESRRGRRDREQESGIRSNGGAAIVVRKGRGGERGSERETHTPARIHHPTRRQTEKTGQKING